MHGSDGSPVQLDVNWVKNNECRVEKGIKANKYYENDAIEEHIVISCSLVLSIVSETEKMVSMTFHDRWPHLWLSLED